MVPRLQILIFALYKVFGTENCCLVVSNVLEHKTDTKILIVVNLINVAVIIFLIQTPENPTHQIKHIAESSKLYLLSHLRIA